MFKGLNVALSSDEKRRRRLDREIESLNKIKLLKSYAAVLDHCATTFQKLRVLQSTDDHGVCVCITCGKIMHYRDKNSQGGHFINRHHTAALFVPMNVNVQCGLYCNGQGGKPHVYRRWLVKKLGEKSVEELESLARSKKYTMEELAEWRVDWLAEIRTHEKRLAGL